jgi:twitching motility protein PilT
LDFPYRNGGWPDEVAGPKGTTHSGMKIDQYFKNAIDKKASDVHLVSGAPPSLRIAGKLTFLEEQAMTSDDLNSMVQELITKDQYSRFLKERDFDTAHSFDEWRFRINLHFQRGTVGLAARLIPSTVPTPAALGFDETLHSLTQLNSGLVLVTGPSGSGKSTTLAAMIEMINKERRAHIITIEDPIEFIYKDNQSLIEQRELGDDTHSFDGALKYVLRQDPNVILLGEMRDHETIQAALTAAETGHLVLSTLHTKTAAGTVERIIDMFEGARQRQILLQLAASLRAVVSQQLIPTLKGGLVAAREVMKVNPAVGNLIRENKVVQIASVIQTSVKEGMIPMEMAVKKLHKDNIIAEEYVGRGKERGKTF